MNFVLVGGVNYYYEGSTVQPFVQHFMQGLVAKYGNDLDAGCTPVVRHKAIWLMRRFGALNV